MKKNVLLIVPLLHQGGLERICAMTAKLLSPYCNVTMVIFSKKDMIYDVSGIELIDLDLYAAPTKVGKVINLIKRIRAIKKIKRDYHIDITYSFGPSATLPNIYARTGDKIWTGIRAYGAVEDKKVMKQICRYADKIICCSEVMRQTVNELYGVENTICLYNPCDVNMIREKAEETPQEHRDFFTTDAPILASMGREDDVKGFWHLIKAFALAKKRIPELKLMIIGEGTFMEYRKLAKELQVEKDVLFTGVQVNPFSYLKYASLYVMTSISEGFPNALIEAMAIGIPVMSVNCKSGPAEILLEDFGEGENTHIVIEGQYGILLPVICPDKNLDASSIEPEERIMAEEIIKIFFDEKKLAKMRKTSEKRAESFSGDCYRKRLISLINNS